MHPRAGIGDFAFDSVSAPETESDFRESHSIERSLRLNPGTYFILVQWGVVTSGGGKPLFALGDWHLTVSQYD